MNLRRLGPAPILPILAAAAVLLAVSPAAFGASGAASSASAAAASSTIAVAAPAAAFRIGALQANPGETVSGSLAVPPAGNEPATAIPVTIIHGAKPGPVLAAVAGVHGAEYPPILALARLRASVDPKTLTGTLLLVHVANLPSFQRRTVYYNPFDWKNLNRVFPGDPNGTMSQRIARVLTDEVVTRCDVLLDMHCGDANEALIPYSYWMISRDAAFNERSKAIALAFGIPHIIIDDTRTQDPADSKYLGNTAVLRGKPAITTESGQLGGVDEADIDRNVEGVRGVMRHMGMIADGPAPCAEPVWIDKYEVVNSGHDGLFHPSVKAGSYVTANQAIGVITDYAGAPLETMRAPFAGILLYVIGTPPANAGEPLFEVGRVKDN